MKATLAAVSIGFVLAGGLVLAQSKDAAIEVTEAETLVKVTKVDREARTVTFRNPTGALVTLNVPPEAQNLDQVKPGAVFKVRYVESVALVLSKGGSVSSTSVQAVRLAPKGGNPGGTVVETRQITGRIEALDRANRSFAVRGPRGNVLVLKAAADAQGFDDVGVGDTISLIYSEALALEMVPRAAKAGASGK